MINEILTMNGYGLYVWSAFSFTIPPILILLLLISDKIFISVGDLKYTTFSSSDLRIRKIDSDKIVKIKNTKKKV